MYGKVTLSSGREADYYVDLRRITLDGEAAPLVGVLVVEDTTTTGASPMAAVAAAREEGAEVVAVATIADRAMFIGDKTVSVHVTNVFRKTGTANRIEAASLALRLGLN